MSAADAASLNFWSCISLFGIILVFFGVVFEGAELFVRLVAFSKRRKLKLVWTKLPEVHVPSWVHVMDHFGWFILVLGLALEWRGHVKIEEINDRESRRLNSELAAATKVAGMANERASLTESNNLVLRSNVVSLEAQLLQVSTNVAKNDPITGPIRTVEAHVFFMLDKPVVAKNRNVFMKCASLRLWNAESASKDRLIGFAVIDLMTEQFNSSELDGKQMITLDFRLSPDRLGFGGGIIPRDLSLSADEMVKAIDGFRLDVWFLPEDAQITQGYVAFKVNNVLEKELKIPPQKRGRWMLIVNPPTFKPADE